VLIKRGAWTTRPFELPALDRAPASTAPCLPAATGAEHHADLEHAWQEGFARGLAEARELASAEPVEEHAALVAEIASINELLESLEQRVAMFVLAMSLEVSRLVVRSAVQIKPDLVLPALRDALGSVAGLARETRIHFHPADAARVGSLEATDGGVRLPWLPVADEALAPGQCRLVAARLGPSAGSATPLRQVLAGLSASSDWIGTTDRDEHEVAS
jgi:flagellar assembly protein FliH